MSRDAELIVSRLSSLTEDSSRVQSLETLVKNKPLPRANVSQAMRGLINRVNSGGGPKPNGSGSTSPTTPIVSKVDELAGDSARSSEEIQLEVAGPSASPEPVTATESRENGAESASAVASIPLSTEEAVDDSVPLGNESKIADSEAIGSPSLVNGTSGQEVDNGSSGATFVNGDLKYPRQASDNESTLPADPATHAERQASPRKSAGHVATDNLEPIGDEDAGTARLGNEEAELRGNETEPASTNNIGDGPAPVVPEKDNAVPTPKPLDPTETAALNHHSSENVVEETPETGVPLPVDKEQ